jgi:hypothetical protein
MRYTRLRDYKKDIQALLEHLNTYPEEMNDCVVHVVRNRYGSNFWIYTRKNLKEEENRSSYAMVPIFKAEPACPLSEGLHAGFPKVDYSYEEELETTLKLRELRIEDIEKEKSDKNREGFITQLEEDLVNMNKKIEELEELIKNRKQ